MRLLIRRVAGMGMIFLLLIAVLYIDFKLGYQADLDACPKVTSLQVVAAVIKDITRKDNRNFSQFNLSSGDVLVDHESIQIGPSSVLTPFRIASDPQRQYFAMPRCYVLSDREYASD